MDISKIIAFDDEQDISTGYVSTTGNVTPTLQQILNEVTDSYNRSQIAKTWPLLYIETGDDNLKTMGMDIAFITFGTNPEWELAPNLHISLYYKEGEPVSDIFLRFIEELRENKYQVINVDFPNQLTRLVSKINYAERWRQVNQLDVVGELTDVYETFYVVVSRIVDTYFSGMTLNESVVSNLISFDGDIDTSTGHISVSRAEYPRPEFEKTRDFVWFLEREYGARKIDFMIDGGVDGEYDVIFSPYGKMGELWGGWEYEGSLDDLYVWVDMFRKWARKIRSGGKIDLCDRENVDDPWMGNDQRHDEFVEVVRNATQEILMVLDGHHPQAGHINESEHRLVSFDNEDDVSTGYVNVGQEPSVGEFKTFKNFRSWFFFVARLLEKERIIAGYLDDKTYDEDDNEGTRYILQFFNGRNAFGPRYYYFGVTLLGDEDSGDPDYAYFCFKQELFEEIENFENGNYSDNPEILKDLKFIESNIVRWTRYYDTGDEGPHLFLRIHEPLRKMLEESVQTNLLSFDDGADTSTGFVSVLDNNREKEKYADLFGTYDKFEGYMKKFFGDEYERNIYLDTFNYPGDVKLQVRVEPEDIYIEFHLSDDFNMMSDDEKIEDLLLVMKEELEYPDVAYNWFYDHEQDPDDERDEETWGDEVMDECNHIKRAFDDFVETVEKSMTAGRIVESLSLLSFDDDDTSTGHVSAGGKGLNFEPISGIRFLKWIYDNGGYDNSEGFTGNWNGEEDYGPLTTMDLDCPAEEHFGGGGYDYPDDATFADFIDVFDGNREVWFEYFYVCWGGPVLGQTFLEGNLNYTGDDEIRLYDDYDAFVKWLDELENTDARTYIKDNFYRDIHDYAFMMIEKEHGKDYFKKLTPQEVHRVMNDYREGIIDQAEEPIRNGLKGLVGKGRKLLADYKVYCATIDRDN